MTWRRVFATINDNDLDGGLQFVSIQMAADGAYGFAVGNFRQLTTVLVTTDGGESWNYAFEPKQPQTDLVFDIFLDEADTLHIVGFAFADGYSMLLRLNPPVAAGLAAQ
eukprot:TRINITY_DN2344_c0_g1_i1.p2 TRINITY_DN2344_c0_g1~~TRINITY_DN2344_c0_g1_i1.p2  ORF type:complete len:109 (+),score=24.54 TRINITY_DN2344_c0_g1_i1:152-478(+)